MYVPTKRFRQVDGGVGPFIGIYRRCSDIAELLENSSSRKLDLEVNYLDTRKGDGTGFAPPFDGDVCGVSTGRTSFGEDDEWFFIILTAFNMLRECKKIKINVPGDNQAIMEGNGNHILDEYERLLARTKTSQELPTDEHWSQQKDLVLIDIENMLDSADGEIANRLRLHRCAYWYEFSVQEISPGQYSKYEANVEHIIFSSVLDDEQRLLSAKCVNRRQVQMRLNNPDSVYKEFGRYEKWDLIYLDANLEQTSMKTSMTVTKAYNAGLNSDALVSDKRRDSYFYFGLPDKPGYSSHQQLPDGYDNHILRRACDWVRTERIASGWVCVGLSSNASNGDFVTPHRKRSV